LGFIITSIFLVFKSTDDYTLYQNTNLWLPFIVISLIVLTGLFFSGGNPFIGKIRIDIFFIIIIGLAYAYGFTREINCAFDYSDAKVYEATVLGRREYTGRHDSWYLTLTPWGPRQYIKEEEIDGYLYDHVKIGDTVKVNFKQGLLNVPWFVVTKN
jgi:hypothetical protein